MLLRNLNKINFKKYNIKNYNLIFILKRRMEDNVKEVKALTTKVNIYLIK